MGVVKTMANRKLELIRTRLQREIERVGMSLVIHRTKYKSDGSNGFIPDGETVFDIQGIVKHLTSAASSSFTYMDGGKHCTITETLSVLYDGTIDFKMYDWFIFDGIKCTIMQISDVGEQHVYWLLGCTTEPVEVPKYGE